MKTALLGSRKLSAAIAALAIGSLSIVGASPASAAEEDLDLYNGQITKNSGTLTIHKLATALEGIDVDVRGPGQTDLTERLLGGAGFTVYNLVDTTPANTTDPAAALFGADRLKASADAWSEVEAISQDVPAYLSSITGFGPVASAEQLTEADEASSLFGTTKFTLPVGAYLVVETTKPAGTAFYADPFVVTVPFPVVETVGTGEDAKIKHSWLYDLNVYPKNVRTNIDKDVTLPSVGVPQIGDELQFPVTVDVPVLEEGKTYSKFTVKDSADPTRVDVTGVASVTVDGAVVDASNYTVSTSAGNPKVTAVLFTNSWINEQQGKKLVVTFEGTVKGFSEDGESLNQAELTFDGLVEPIVDEAATYWGEAQFLKVSAQDTDVTLAGAEFAYFDGGLPVDGQCVAPGSLPGNAQALGAVTSDANGVITVSDLFVGKSPESQRCYVFQETKAPLGFSLSPILVSILVEAGPYANSELIRFENPASQVLGDVKLPLTGAAGQVLLMIGGLAIVAISAGTFVVRRRRQA